MAEILDALDELTRARDLVQLIEMTPRYMPEDDRKARASGCEAALIRLNAGLAKLCDAQKRGVAPSPIPIRSGRRPQHAVASRCAARFRSSRPG